MKIGSFSDFPTQSSKNSEVQNIKIASFIFKENSGQKYKVQDNIQRVAC